MRSTKKTCYLVITRKMSADLVCDDVSGKSAQALTVARHVLQMYDHAPDSVDAVVKAYKRMQHTAVAHERLFKPAGAANEYHEKGGRRRDRPQLKASHRCPIPRAGPDFSCAAYVKKHARVARTTTVAHIVRVEGRSHTPQDPRKHEGLEKYIFHNLWTGIVAKRDL